MSAPRRPGGISAAMCEEGVIGALRHGRRMAQNAPMKIAIYMVGTLALIVIGSLTWTTMLLGSH
jgi:hypothetical protein